MNNKKQGYVLITDHQELPGRYLVQTRGFNGKIMQSSVEALNKPETVINNILRTAEVYGGSLKKSRIFDGTDKGKFFERGLASKRYTPRS